MPTCWWWAQKRWNLGNAVLPKTRILTKVYQRLHISLISVYIEALYTGYIVPSYNRGFCRSKFWLGLKPRHRPSYALFPVTVLIVIVSAASHFKATRRNWCSPIIKVALKVMAHSVQIIKRLLAKPTISSLVKLRRSIWRVVLVSYSKFYVLQDVCEQVMLLAWYKNSSCRLCLANKAATKTVDTFVSYSTIRVKKTFVLHACVFIGGEH